MERMKISNVKKVVLYPFQAGWQEPPIIRKILYISRMTQNGHLTAFQSPVRSKKATVPRALDRCLQSTWFQKPSIRCPVCMQYMRPGPILNITYRVTHTIVWSGTTHQWWCVITIPLTTNVTQTEHDPNDRAINESQNPIQYAETWRKRPKER